jgi:hypothetical protein
VNKLVKFLLASLFVSAIAVLLIWLFGVLSFTGAFDKTVTRTEAADNFKKNEAAIMQLADLMMANRPQDKELYLSVDGKRVELTVAMKNWMIDQRYPNSHYRFRISSTYSGQPFLTELGWDEQTLNRVIQLLKYTDCQSISTDDARVDFNYRTGTWSSYGYCIRKDVISDSLRKVYDSIGIQVLNSRTTITSSHAL